MPLAQHILHILLGGFTQCTFLESHESRSPGAELHFNSHRSYVAANWEILCKLQGENWKCQEVAHFSDWWCLRGLFFPSKTQLLTAVSSTTAELWWHVIQCSHHDSWSQIHALVMASLVHVLPTGAGQGIPIAGSQLARGVHQQNKQHDICSHSCSLGAQKTANEAWRYTGTHWEENIIGREFEFLHFCSCFQTSSKLTLGSPAKMHEAEETRKLCKSTLLLSMS